MSTRYLSPAEGLLLTGIGSGAVAIMVVSVPLGICVALAVFAIACTVIGQRNGLALWQISILLLVAGYGSLNYGFANIVLPGFPPIMPLGHLILFVVLLLAVVHRRNALLGAFVAEPLLLLWILLLAEAALHLSADVLKYGGMAIRDASFVIEGVCLWMGYVWAQSRREQVLCLRALVLIFATIFLYSLTFPIKDVLLSASPVSGAFQSVAIVGHFSEVPHFLVFGSLFSLLVAGNVSSRAVSGGVFGFVQLAWSFIFQRRALYLGLALAMFLVACLSNLKRSITIGVMLLASLVSVLVLAQSLGLSGKRGEMTTEFFTDHFRSIALTPGTPDAGSVAWRIDLMDACWDRWRSSGRNVAVGEGFGRALIDYRNPNGIFVRQPHNTHITIAMRLGLLGLGIWSLMQFRVLQLCVNGLKTTVRGSPERNLVVWIILFYLLGMLTTSVQPWLEFSFGAIPFYFIIGFSTRLLATLPKEARQRSVHVPGIAPSSRNYLTARRARS